jgi:hypothetical protein
MVKKTLLIYSLFILLALVFMAGCVEESQTTQETRNPKENEDNTGMGDDLVCAADVNECPDGSFVSRDSTNNCEFSPCPEIETVTLSDEIIAIQNNIDSIKSYEYHDSSTKYIILVKGDNAVIMTPSPNEFRKGEINFNAMFLNKADMSATAACIPSRSGRTTFTCGKSANKYAEFSYSGFEFPNPFIDLIEMKDGKVVGTQMCEKRECKVIEYTKNSIVYRMYVRPAYPLPYKIVEIDSSGKEINPLIYSNAVFNSLEDSEMMVPSDYVLVE